MILETLADPEALAQRAASWLAETLAGTQGRCAVSLSGGSTPKRLYALLAAPPFLAQVPWDRVHWFWGDERFVPPEDSRSNFRMVKQAMLDAAPVPPANIHPVPTAGLSAEEAAQRYQAELMTFYGADMLNPVRPLFDVTLLGLGTNGHTASLFPDEAVLDVEDEWAAAVTPPGEPTRITLTYPPLNSSRHVAFLVAGADKREMLGRLRQGDLGIPAGRISPVGELRIFADQGAVG